MPRRPYAKITHTVIRSPEDFQVAPPERPEAFFRRLRLVLQETSENPRLGVSPGDSRPFPRNKVACAYLESLRISAKAIAETAGNLTNTRVSSTLVRKWRVEDAYQALVKKAQEETVNELFDKYIKLGEDRKIFDAFRDEMIECFSPLVTLDVILEIKKLAESKPDNWHDANWTYLLTDLDLSEGIWPRRDSRQAIQRHLGDGKAFESALLVTTHAFALAKIQGDWAKAEEAFTTLLRYAGLSFRKITGRRLSSGAVSPDADLDARLRAVEEIGRSFGVAAVGGKPPKPHTKKSKS